MLAVKGISGHEHRTHLVTACLFYSGRVGWSGWAQGITTVWDGSIITFNHPSGADSGVRDQLTPGVALTRGNSQGLFNVVTEAAYTHSFSRKTPHGPMARSKTTPR